MIEIMVHLIDKDALVAWIKNRFLPTVNPNADEWEMGACAERVNILNFIDTLKVKGVDLEKEYDRYYEQERNIQTFKLAKHFYELGLKTKKGK